MRFIVNAIAQTPLAFRNGRSETDSATLPYIPGSALLGGLADAHTLLHPGQTDQFEQFFFQGARFSNLYPASSDRWQENERVRQALTSTDLPVYPLPNTARSCKRFSGFRFDQGKNDRHHGISDHLFHWLLFALSDQKNATALIDHQACSHNGCDETVDRVEGFYRRGYTPNEYGQATAKEMLRTRTGINRATGTVQQQILYSRTVLAEGSNFWGTVEIDDTAANDFLEFAEQASETGLIRIGNNRTRGLGRIAIGLDETPLDPPTEQKKLEERLKKFNATLQAEAKAAGMTLGHSFYVPLHFTADTILLDPLLRPHTTLTPDYLRWVVGFEDIEVLYRNYHTRRVMSWNNLWRLPKPDELAIAMGAVFVIGFNRPVDDTLYQTLLKLHLNGLGERRVEGFGQLLIANPFHWEAQNI